MPNPFAMLEQFGAMQQTLESAARDFAPDVFLRGVTALALRAALQMARDAGPPPDLAPTLGVSETQARSLYDIVLEAALRRGLGPQSLPPHKEYSDG